MRRPIVLILIGFSSGIALEFYTGLEALFIILGLASIAIFFTSYHLYCPFKKFRRLIRILSIFLIAILFGSLYFHIEEVKTDPICAYEGQIVKVAGTILSMKKKDEDYYSLVIKASYYLDRENELRPSAHGKWLVSVSGKLGKPEGLIGKPVELLGRVELPSQARNPGLFNYKLYLRTVGIQSIIKAKANNLVILEGEEASINLWAPIAKLKYGFLNKVEPLMDREAYGIFIGMLFGDVSNMEEDIYEAFQKNGIGHILSVSGIHVALVYLYINRLLAGKNALLPNLCAIAMLILYAALSEFSPPVVRAVLMIVIHIISKITFHRYDFTSCICFSALLMLLLNPFYLFNTGFQLSYMAVLCLAVVLPWVNRKLELVKEITGWEKTIKVCEYMAPLFVIQLGMLPLTAYLFNYFSIVSFFMNLPIIALSGVIIPIGISLIAWSILGGGVVFGVGVTAAELLINFMILLNQALYLPGIGFFNAVSPSIGMIIIYYFLLFFLCSEFTSILYQRRKIKVITVLITVFLIFALSFTIFTDKGYHKAALVFLDVGQGDCLHIRTPNGKNILIDGGGNPNYDVGKKTLLPYLLKNKVSSVDLAIVTHLHDDHYLGLAQLSNYLEVEKLGMYAANKYGEDRILANTGIDKDKVFYLTAGTKINIEKDIWIEVLYPEKKTEEEYKDLYFNSEDENENSLFIMIHYKGLKVLMTGDIGFEGEDKLLKSYGHNLKNLQANILKVGHHGSKYSTGEDFLKTVNPEVAIFQVGKNNFYGHPHVSVLEKCGDMNIMIYRNDFDGAIIIHEQEKKWQIKKML